MAEIQTETKGGIELHFVEAQGGIRIYLLPNIPADFGEIPSEKNFDLEKAVGMFPIIRQEKVRKIGTRYKGRQLDTTSILLYAHERDRFDEFANRLDNKPSDFEYIHPGLMMARTDVSAFFMRMYADLKIAPEEVARRAERQVEVYGIGVVILPRGKKIRDYC